ncbi:MAG: YHS domain-containing (seleno)protein [Burkholderiales bacterium]
MSLKLPTISALLLLIALLSGCATNNVISDGADANLMLRGNDPVAYFTMDKAVKGDPAIKADHDGVTYRFVSNEHREMFQRDPKKYTPAYGGTCAGGANYALKTPIGAETFKIEEGRLFMFGGASSKRHWEMDEVKNIAMADAYWENEMKNVPMRLQNYKRWIFRVPHYKTDAELEAEWQARSGRK